MLRHATVAAGGLSVTNPVTHDPARAGPGRPRSSTKFVPGVYLDNSFAVRLAVLQGLLDTDGGPVTQGGRTCRVQYTTTSARLRDDVVYLVRSLGGVAYARTRPRPDAGPGLARQVVTSTTRDAFVLDIRMPAGLPPSALLASGTSMTAAGGGRPMRFVDGIEPVGTQDTMCIQVAAATRCT